MNDEEVDWNELLRILQEEYTKLVLNHYDLTKKIMKCPPTDSKKRTEYELKADYLNKKMKEKAKQINKLKTLQQQIKTLPGSLPQKLVEVHDANEFMGVVVTQKQNEGPLHRVVCNTTSRSINNISNNNTNTTTSKKSGLNSSSTSLFYENCHNSSSNGFNTLQLFKDIKNLQQKIQYDLDY